MDPQQQNLIIELIKSNAERAEERFDSLQTSVNGVNRRLDVLNSKTYTHAVDIGRLKLAMYGIIGTISVAALGALFNFIASVAASSVK